MDMRVLLGYINHSALINKKLAEELPQYTEGFLTAFKRYVFTWIIKAVAEGYSVELKGIGTFVPVIKHLKSSYMKLISINYFDKEKMPVPESSIVTAMGLTVDKDLRKELTDVASKLPPRKYHRDNRAGKSQVL